MASERNPMKGHIMKTATRSAAIACLIIAPATLHAKDQAEPRPEIFRKLIDCRAIADSAARLACFDTNVAKLDEAESRSEVVIVDKAQVKKAKRSLFGLTLPNLGIFGGGQDENSEAAKQEDETIETTVKSAYVNSAGKVTVIIDDGSKWVQIDTREVRTPKPGQPIRIRRAALGSFLANLNGQIAIRMRREN